jgi:hypothetical protein
MCIFRLRTRDSILFVRIVCQDHSQVTGNVDRSGLPVPEFEIIFNFTQLKDIKLMSRTLRQKNFDKTEVITLLWPQHATEVVKWTQHFP